MEKIIETQEEKKSSERKDILDEIESLIRRYWGVTPAYYLSSTNKTEQEAAKTCCCILKLIQKARKRQ